ncbi:MAG: hypothetical protein N2249_03955 [Melioribacter sp.]|nr:hypothetical protein [Melioribacter sp.]
METAAIKYIDQPVVIEKNIITGRDPASALEFVDKFLMEFSKSL